MTFDQHILSYSDNLKSFALKLTKNIDDSEDLIQETMFKALVNEDKFKAGTNLKAWLFTIMKNIFINSYRRKIKRNTLIDSTNNHYFINSVTIAKSIANRAERSFVMNDIQSAIASLPGEFKIPFNLYFQGFKYQEIADQLKLPLGTVKSRIFFARKALKRELHEYKDDRYH